jgi:hypothetical protein
MRTRGEWAEEHWDVLVIVAAFVLAVALSLALGVAYNVAAIRLEPPAAELRSTPPAPGPDPRYPTAPYS